MTECFFTHFLRSRVISVHSWYLTSFCILLFLRIVITYCFWNLPVVNTSSWFPISGTYFCFSNNFLFRSYYGRLNPKTRFVFGFPVYTWKRLPVHRSHLSFFRNFRFFTCSSVSPFLWLKNIIKNKFFQYVMLYKVAQK